MIRIIRTRTLRQTAAQIIDLHDRAEAQRTRAERALADAERTHELQASLARAEGALEILRAQHLLDTEDRVTLRALLRTSRKQSRPADRVFVLFRMGELHSLHASQDAAEIAAEAEGAPRSGWTADAPGAALPPASTVAWRVQALPLQT